MSQSQPEEFPLHALPLPVMVFVFEVAEALGVDLALVAGPCLAVLAACIGNRRRIILKSSWREPAILWVVVVMRSGGGKTPAISAVLQHLHDREAAVIEEEKVLWSEYEKQNQAWQAMRQNQRRKPPEKPGPARRFLVSDTTIEALLAVHERAPNGLLVHRDELGGLFRSFNQYKARGAGSDAQTWNELYQGNPALIDRKGGPTLSVRRAAVSIIGGIQPALIRSVLTGEHIDDGMAARLLFVVPPEQVKTWTENTLSDAAIDAWTSVLDDLLALMPNSDGSPIDLPLTEDAKAEWVSYYNAHAEREHQEDGPLRAALAKLEGMAARLALVLQLAADPKATEIGVKAMRGGIQLAEWFEGQARTLYEGLKVREQERDHQAAYDWIAAQGETTTQRDFARLGPGRLRKRAAELLGALVADGRAKLSWKTYTLCDCDTCDNGAQ